MTVLKRLFDKFMQPNLHTAFRLVPTSMTLNDLERAVSAIAQHLVFSLPLRHAAQCHKVLVEVDLGRSSGVLHRPHS